MPGDRDHTCILPDGKYSAPSSRAFAFSGEGFGGIEFCPWRDCWLLPIVSREELSEIQKESAEAVRHKVAEGKFDEKEMRDVLAVEGEWYLRRSS